MTAKGVTITAPESSSVGEAGEFKVTIESGSGSGPLNVSVKAALTPKPLEVVDNGNMTMSVKFTPRANGPHEFTFTWGDEAVEGSPMKIEVGGEAPRDASKVTVDCPKEGKVNEAFKMTVVAAEEAGPGPLTVDTTGPGEPKIDLVATGQGGNFEATITCPKAGKYDVAVNWGEDNPVPGSPFNVVIAE
eukprot:NODE_1491_length_837_cov_331.461972_g1443_i0.p1 GENE.NODE_1491_length_837_cov_331.461972_g1443_i0~~NODE_1491_length_837_cov_331.461972_g1443_i0.p1  ORF type:complete len:189 (+),score=57.39 NODE_1491_length_837_cov_331.461972_g1443_i0:83-649(+)